MTETLVLMEGIEKFLTGVQALNQCKFELRSGEAYALPGENGAGKSTLMEVLSGVHTKDAGKIFYKGKDVEIINPRAAQQLGVSIIHQELNLMNNLTAQLIIRNLFHLQNRSIQLHVSKRKTDE